MTNFIKNKQLTDWMIKLFIPILSTWLIWVTKAVVSLQSDVAVIKYGVFKTFSNAEPTPEQTVRRPHLDADMNILRFLERKN